MKTKKPAIILNEGPFKEEIAKLLKKESQVDFLMQLLLHSNLPDAKQWIQWCDLSFDALMVKDESFRKSLEISFHSNTQRENKANQLDQAAQCIAYLYQQCDSEVQEANARMSMINWVTGLQNMPATEELCAKAIKLMGHEHFNEDIKQICQQTHRYLGEGALIQNKRLLAMNEEWVKIFITQSMAQEQAIDAAGDDYLGQDDHWIWGLSTLPLETVKVFLKVGDALNMPWERYLLSFNESHEVFVNAFDEALMLLREEYCTEMLKRFPHLDIEASWKRIKEIPFESIPRGFDESMALALSEKLILMKTAPQQSSNPEDANVERAPTNLRL